MMELGYSYYINASGCEVTTGNVEIPVEEYDVFIDYIIDELYFDDFNFSDSPTLTKLKKKCIKSEREFAKESDNYPKFEDSDIVIHLDDALDCSVYLCLLDYILKQNNQKKADLFVTAMLKASYDDIDSFISNAASINSPSFEYLKEYKIKNNI